MTYVPRMVPVEPALTGFVNYRDNGAPNFSRVAYWKDAYGVVHLRGVALNNSGGNLTNVNLFTLPAGFRAPRSEPFVAFANVLGAIQVGIDGVLAGWVTPGAVNIFATVANGQFVSLSGISFLALA